MNCSPPFFTLADVNRAAKEWGANCGPVAIAAIAQLTLDQLRPSLSTFEQKRYTNPTLMWAILNNLQLRTRLRADKDFPNYGLVRIQWEGPWTQPEVPIAARYRHTHWVGAARRDGQVGIFDVNCMNVGGWVSLADWSGRLVPWLLKECVPRATGGWHLTHSIEVTL